MGAGVGWGNFPYYPGSKARRNLVIPFPSFVFRGDTFLADEDGPMRLRLVHSKRFEITSSFGFNPPFSSENVPVRKGMDDLNTLLELGPSFMYHIIPRSQDKIFNLSISLNTRLAMQTNFKSLKESGVIIDPLLHCWTKLSKRIVLYTGLRFSWSSRKHQSFYYDVPSKFSTPQRPSFQSKSGLFSVALTNFAIINLNKRWTFFAGLFYDDFSYAKNSDSPLHQVDRNLASLVGFTYWFYTGR